MLMLEIWISGFMIVKISTSVWVFEDHLRLQAIISRIQYGLLVRRSDHLNSSQKLNYRIRIAIKIDNLPHLHKFYSPQATSTRPPKLKSPQ